jgi:flagellar export protein FliJ
VKVYRFSLEIVMRIRAIEERLAREKLVTAQRDLRRARGAYVAAETAIATLAAPTGPITVGEVRWIGEQADRLADEVRVRRQVVVAAASTRDEARDSWHAARKSLGTLERLDLQGLARWKNEVAREEVSEMDDLANTRHGSQGARI